MAAVRDVPDMTRQKMTVGARHHLFLELHFQPQKGVSKLLNDVSELARKLRLQLQVSEQADRQGSTVQRFNAKPLTNEVATGDRMIAIQTTADLLDACLPHSPS
jgi:hypothetical protein